MLMLGKIGKIRILPQYGKSFYHRSISLSTYFFQLLPGIFPRYFLQHIPLLLTERQGNILYDNLKQGSYSKNFSKSLTLLDVDYKL